MRTSKQHYFLQLECAIVEFVQFLTVAMEKQERLNRKHKISFADHCYRITESTFWTFPRYCTWCSGYNFLMNSISSAREALFHSVIIYVQANMRPTHTVQALYDTNTQRYVQKERKNSYLYIFRICFMMKDKLIQLSVKSVSVRGCLWANVTSSPNSCKECILPLAILFLLTFNSLNFKPALVN